MSTSSTDIRGQAEESAKKLVTDSRTAARGRVRRPTDWARVSAGDSGGADETDAVLNFFSCKTSPAPSIWDNSLRAVSAQLCPYASCPGWE